jgi:antitoxin CptB
MDREHRIKRLRFRAWHRGTREADYLIGGYFDRYAEGWNDEEIGWFEALMDEQDVDIIAWAFGTAEAPAQWQGEMMDRLRRLDFIQIKK